MRPYAIVEASFTVCEAVVFVPGSRTLSQQDELESSQQASNFNDVSHWRKMVFFVMGINA